MTTTLPVPTVPVTRPRKYMLVGGLVGLLAGLVVTFVLALLDARAHGMTAGSCIVYGCVLTLLVSQAVGLPGMMAGASLGALAGAALGMIRERPSRVGA